MNILEGYTPISTQKIELDDDTVRTLIIPENPICTAATVSSFGGFSLYSIVEGDPPDATYGRPLPDGEEVVLISNLWMKNFQIIRAQPDVTYVYVTFYQNG